ncbi:MAG: hypothetical protein WA864_21500 [Acetobacteraceae bacterium]
MADVTLQFARTLAANQGRTKSGGALARRNWGHEIGAQTTTSA